MPQSAQRSVGPRLGRIVDQLAKELIRFFQPVLLEVKEGQLQVMANSQSTIAARAGILFHGLAQELLLLPLFGHDWSIGSGWEGNRSGGWRRGSTVQPSRRPAAKQSQCNRHRYQSRPPSARAGRPERLHCTGRWRRQLEGSVTELRLQGKCLTKVIQLLEQFPAILIAFPHIFCHHLVYDGA